LRRRISCNELGKPTQRTGCKPANPRLVSITVSSWFIQIVGVRTEWFRRISPSSWRSRSKQLLVIRNWPMTVVGQKAKYSLRAHRVRFAPDYGLKSNIAARPSWAKLRHRACRGKNAYTKLAMMMVTTGCRLGAPVNRLHRNDNFVTASNFDCRGHLRVIELDQSTNGHSGSIWPKLSPNGRRSVRISVPQMRNLRKIALSVAVGAIALGGLRALNAYDGEAISIALAGRADLLVEKERTPWSSLVGIPTDGHGEYLKLTNIGRSAITVRNVAINDMEHCAKLGDVSKFELPLTLPELGGWATLRVVCPGAIAKVTVETSRESTTYSWKVAAGMVEE
jgi:hypothetical protein